MGGGLVGFGWVVCLDENDGVWYVFGFELFMNEEGVGGEERERYGVLIRGSIYGGGLVVGKRKALEM